MAKKIKLVLVDDLVVGPVWLKKSHEVLRIARKLGYPVCELKAGRVSAKSFRGYPVKKGGVR